MTDPVKRPAPIQERWGEDLSKGGAIVLKEKRHTLPWVVLWSGSRAKEFGSFEEAIQFATRGREIAACS